MNKENNNVAEFNVKFVFLNKLGDNLTLYVSNKDTVEELVQKLNAIKAEMDEAQFEIQLNSFWSSFFEMMTTINA